MPVLEPLGDPEEEVKNFQSRREDQGHYWEVLYGDLRLRRTKLDRQVKWKRKIKLVRTDFTFLQYYPLVISWASQNFKISRDDLEALIYIQPLMVVTPKQFKQEMKAMGDLSSERRFERLKKEGWLYLYSDQGPRARHYSLTQAAVMLVQRVHRITIGEEPLPKYRMSNPLVKQNEGTKKEPVFQDILGRMNDRVKREG